MELKEDKNRKGHQVGRKHVQASSCLLLLLLLLGRRTVMVEVCSRVTSGSSGGSGVVEQVGAEAEVAGE